MILLPNCRVKLSGEHNSFRNFSLYLADFLSCLEDISSRICTLVYDKQTLNYEAQQKSHLLILSIQILDHTVAMFHSHSIKMAAPLYNFLTEVVYLPWTESIDPPWFDWKPEVHKENEIKTVRENLVPSLGTSFITTALRVILKLPISNHILWKVHIFRTALVSIASLSFDESQKLRNRPLVVRKFLCDVETMLKNCSSNAILAV